MKRIAVAGAGSVGGIVAWHLARAGAAPTVVARPASARLLAREGLVLADGSSAETVRLAATDDPASLGPQDLVFAGFKAQDWPAGLALVRPLLGPGTLLVPLLNGIPWWYFGGLGGAFAGRRVAAVDPDGVLKGAIPAQAVIGCVAYLAASRQAPNRIVWNGRKRLLLGEPSGGVTPRLRGIAGLLTDAGLNAEAAPDIRREIWRKLLGNANYNPLSVVTGATIGRMASHKPLRRIVRAIMLETIAVAAALRVPVDVDVEERLKVAPEMVDFKTSMLQDYEAGRPLELSAVVEAVVELGGLVGVPTPTLETIGALALERWHAAHACKSTAQGARVPQ